MIERQTFGSRDAVVMYMTKDMQPSSREDAEMVKITYEDNGETGWLLVQQGPEDEDDTEEGEESEDDDIEEDVSLAEMAGTKPGGGAPGGIMPEQED